MYTLYNTNFYNRKWTGENKNTIKNITNINFEDLVNKKKTPKIKTKENISSFMTSRNSSSKTNNIQDFSPKKVFFLKKKVFFKKFKHNNIRITWNFDNLYNNNNLTLKNKDWKSPKTFD